MVQSMLKKFWFEEDGQDMVEYSLLLAFIALGATALGSTLQGYIKTIWTNVSTTLSNASTASS